MAELEKRIKLLEAKLDVISICLSQLADNLKTIASLYYEAEAKASNEQPILVKTFKKAGDMRPYNWLTGRLNDFMANGYIMWCAENADDKVTVKIFKTEKTIEAHLQKVRGWIEWAEKAMLKT